MTTIADAGRALKNLLGVYQERRPTRTAVLGDGRGFATSNLFVPGMDSYVWARESYNSNSFFPVLNRASFGNAIDAPVFIGYSEAEPNIEQVLGIHYSGLGTISASGLTSVGVHHRQHQFRGADEVHIDSRLLLPGQVHPTNPPSMTVVVEAFNYFWNGWNRFAQTTTSNLSQYKPGIAYGIYVLIALDPETSSLAYHAGIPFLLGLNWAVTSADVSLTNAPAGAGHELPLGFVFLTSNTTAINWTTAQDNIVDARPHNLPNLQYVNDRLRQLEGYTGNEPNLATTGAAASTVDAYDKTLGGLTNVNTTGASDGDALTFDNPTARWLPKAGGTGGAPTNAQYLTLALNGTLSAERVLAMGNGIELTDGGANGNATIDARRYQWVLGA